MDINMIKNVACQETVMQSQKSVAVSFSRRCTAVVPMISLWLSYRRDLVVFGIAACLGENKGIQL